MIFLAFHHTTVQYLQLCFRCFTNEEVLDVDDSSKTSLTDAICSGDEKTLGQLIDEFNEQHSDANTEFLSNYSLCGLTDSIVHALEYHHFEVVLLLLQYHHRTTCKLPKYLMSSNNAQNNRQLLHLLLSYCHDKVLLQRVKLQLIYWAIVKGNHASAQDVLQIGGVNTDIPIGSSSLLHFSTLSHNLLTVDLLVKYGANVNVCDGHEDTPLFMAVRINSLDMAKRLICLGADVNHQNDDHMTPLHIAAASVDDSTAIVDLLLHNGAYFNILDHNGYTPLALGLRCFLSRQMPSKIRCLVRHGSIPMDWTEMTEIVWVVGDPLHEDAVSFMNQTGLLSVIYCQLQAENIEKPWRDIKNCFFARLADHGGEIEISKYNILRSNEPMSLYGICHAYIRIYLSRISRGQSIYNIVQALPLPQSISSDLVLE